MTRILTGADVARRDDCADYGEWVRKRSAEFARRKWIGKAWDGGQVTDLPLRIRARIDFGRWIGDCPDCNGAEYVDPQMPFFFCLSCGNEAVEGKARTVVFPEDREKVEKAVLKIEVDDRRGGNEFQRALMARAGEGGKVRSWRPGDGPGSTMDQSTIDHHVQATEGGKGKNGV